MQVTLLTDKKEIETGIIVIYTRTFSVTFSGSAIKQFSTEIDKTNVMVKALSQEYTYKHPWERVTCAFWRKFSDPENKQMLSHIREVQTLNQKLDPASGKLYTARAITFHTPGPWFIHKIVGQDICDC